MSCDLDEWSETPLSDPHPRVNEEALTAQSFLTDSSEGDIQ
jgi:hypothetical protein